MLAKTQRPVLPYLNWNGKNIILELFSSCKTRKKGKELQNLTCPRCGIIWEASKHVLEKRISRGMDNHEFCIDCLGRVKKSECKPWVGDVDLDTFAPLKNGKPYKPGLRICGRMDCVTTKHIVSPIDDLNKTLQETLAAGLKPCSAEGCGRPVHALGLCQMHYRRDVRENHIHAKGLVSLGDVVDAYKPRPHNVKRCGVVGCQKPHRAKGLCRTHYHFLYRNVYLNGK